MATTLSTASSDQCRTGKHATATPPVSAGPMLVGGVDGRPRQSLAEGMAIVEGSSDSMKRTMRGAEEVKMLSHTRGESGREVSCVRLNGRLSLETRWDP
jgi:hypothetical protein